MCNEACGDNRFEIIEKAKNHILQSTNIETSKAEMAVLDNFLFRCWQMGWLDRYDDQKKPDPPETKADTKPALPTRELRVLFERESDTRPFYLAGLYGNEYSPQPENATVFATVEQADCAIKNIRKKVTDIKGCRKFLSYRLSPDTIIPPQTDDDSKYHITPASELPKIFETDNVSIALRAIENLCVSAYANGKSSITYNWGWLSGAEFIHLTGILTKYGYKVQDADTDKFSYDITISWRK